MLTMTELQERAPSVFAMQPWVETSEKYRFIPTLEIVNALVERGFAVMKANQSSCRIEGKENFTKHVIRFRHSDFALVKERQALMGVPELILTNSHDRTSAYRFYFGIWRQVCQNGLIACPQDFGFSVRHSGSKDVVQEVIDASYKVIEAAPQITEKVENWSQRYIGHDTQVAFATAALQLRDSPIKVDPVQLMASRNHFDAARADGSRNIWTTYNVVQENLIKGGLIGKSETTGKQRKTRAIKSVGADIALNKALWTLTEELSRQVA